MTLTSQITYSSTRATKNKQEEATFSDAVLKGIAKDGGLFVPSKFPNYPLTDALINTSYASLAKAIFSLYLTDFTEIEIEKCVDAAYDSKFSCANIVPLKTFGEVSFVELFHGSTLAFKDMALSILPYFLKTAASKLGVQDEIVILTATSGDTGKAALEGFSNLDGIKIIVFYPTDGVSEVQKKQMTTQEGNNVSVIGITGNFDDAQTGVKNMFLDEALKNLLAEKNYRFSSANSINIGRLLPQIVYYYHAYLELVREGTISSGDLINVTVPTGNFGNILAAYYAKEMGLPINKFICASNVNHILTDFINTGIYDIDRAFEVTKSPSMDILISSNLERLLYALSDQDASEVNRLMTDLKSNHRYVISNEMKKKLSTFYGGFATDTETLETINTLYKAQHYLLDTHTAVAYKVYSDYVKETGDHTHTLIASTASPYKFAGAVASGLGINDGHHNDFELIHMLSKHTGLAIPKPIENLDLRVERHTKTISKDALKEEVLHILT
ncbi:threonine synthase [Fusibacter bizertensis]|uniref:Threonine synthase n=1 Tax=Fusibacter bizertensis TaxID=1488331 RepID=A0ABT6NCD7_9FIRM|nr:threonine synthase [Fusibacter bizertensis]MDH8678025.1 threonine synthase [Fusibacter bizertensis]